MEANIEFERRYLVDHDMFYNVLRNASGYEEKSVTQATMVSPNGCSSRIRLVTTGADVKAYATFKTKTIDGRCLEFEAESPVNFAKTYIRTAGVPILRKRRYIFETRSVGDTALQLRWEVDAFEGEHAGLIIAEIELPSRPVDYSKPVWLKQEITGDHRLLSSTVSRTDRRALMAVLDDYAYDLKA